MRIEQEIIKNLIQDLDYGRKTLPFLKSEYFSERTDRMMFDEITKFVTKYNVNPTEDIIKIEIGNRTDIIEEDVKTCNEFLNHLSKDKSDTNWLIDRTEKFCKDRAVYNAILDSIKIFEGKDKDRSQDSIPHLLTEALGVTFNRHVGHDYLEDADSRYDFYHRVEEKIPFDLDYFNKITKGGLSNKTLNVALAGTGVGKSLFMCHVAANCLLQGQNVLYITMEMAEERIAERIDANLLNMTMDDLKAVEKNVFDTRISKVAQKTQGKLIIKEYPTASAHTGHFRALLEELRVKRDFAPKIIFIDYLNICASSRLRHGSNINSYTYIKAIAEELRGLGVEYNLPIVSATQTTRSGFNNSDPGLEDTSESFGLPATVDFMFALISTEELQEQGQLMVKQLKNRYSDPNYYKRFLVGVDRSRMKLYNIEESAQADIMDQGKVDDIPVFDSTKFGKRMKEQSFEGFNF